jgi:competence protein ComEA
MGPKERAAYAVLIAAGLYIAGYVGQGYLRKPAEILFQGQARAVPGPATPTSPPLHPDVVVVHVAGKVKKPGVVTLPYGSRVMDAIDRAGGATADADLDQINLAAKLDDGTQVSVPAKGTPAVAQGQGETSGMRANAGAPHSRPTGTRGAKSEPAPHSVSLNSADSATLQRLPGVGPSTAQKILEYRQIHSRFATIDELLAVKGIGPKKLEKLRRFLRL